MRFKITLSCAAAALSIHGAAGATTYAGSVVSYDQGANAAASYTDASSAIGSPERFTGEGVFPSGVTPFNPAFGTDELVSVGSGGHLTLGFDRMITDDASHAFGVDFIVFGNAGFFDASFFDADPDNDGAGITGASPSLFGVGGQATVQVSHNGADWVTAATTPLGLFPTLGYSDYAGPTPLTPGADETDFTRALDPALTIGDFADLNFAQILDLYADSGGGIGIDIAGTGLESAAFVRFVNNSDTAFEIDAVSVVPAPGALGTVGVALVFATRRRRV